MHLRIKDTLAELRAGDVVQTNQEAALATVLGGLIDNNAGRKLLQSP
jgi:hypothetical protein